MDAIGCINISCFKQNASIWWIIRKTLQQIVPRIWTTKKVQPRMENDGQPGILIHTNNGFHTELGSPFPGWKIISTHYQGFRNNVQINVQATSKHVVWGLISLILLVFFLTSPSFHSHHPFKTLPKPSPAPDLVKLWWIGNACAACGTSGEEKKNRQSVLDGSETETPFWDTLPKTNGWIPKMMVWKR